MRNLIITEDISRSLPELVNDSIAAIENYSISSQVIVLTKSGKLLILSQDDFSLCGQPIELNIEDVLDDDWFYLSVVVETNSIICISHKGFIVKCSLENYDNFNTTSSSGKEFSPHASLPAVEFEGQVDDGIACAQWNPDHSIIAILSNNDTLLFMTVYMELIKEIPIEPRIVEKFDNTDNNTVTAATASLSWRGDSSSFALATTDKIDSICRVRLYSKDGELIAIARNVADGAAAMVRGLSACVTYAPNGSLVAMPMQKTTSRTQVRVGTQREPLIGRYLLTYLFIATIYYSSYALINCSCFLYIDCIHGTQWLKARRIRCSGKQSATLVLSTKHNEVLMI